MASKDFFNYWKVPMTSTRDQGSYRLYCRLQYDINQDELNSQGTEIFPFSYFENLWLECDLVIKVIKNINNSHKTRTYGPNFGRESFHKSHHVTP